MPLIRYECPGCGAERKHLCRVASQAPEGLECAGCGAPMQICMGAPSSSSRISVDNGVQSRSVEIIPNIVELNRERSLRGPDRGD